ncbi:MAG: hypothetical protein M9900_04325 [Flavobacteriales bacterium]|nr:hypothetical protein [Flavobacteriales bacterium]
MSRLPASWGPARPVITLGLACICATAAPLLHAQGIVPVATLDSSSILIGQQAHVTLSVDYRADHGAVNIQWPQIGDTLTGKVPVLHDSHVDTILPDKQHDPFLFKQVRTLTITSWDSGYWAIPPFRFTINGDTLETAALLLTVNTVAVDTTQAFRDIKEIYTLPFSLVDWLREHWPWIAGGIAAVAILAALFIVLYKRARRPKPVAPPPPVQPLHVRTLLALEALQQQQLWQQGRTKAYYIGLTEILRSYVEERFQVPALEQTTDEILASLRMSAMPRGQQEQLAPLLRLADMVKFAKWSTLPAENEQAMASAIRLVQETAYTGNDAPLA